MIQESGFLLPLPLYLRLLLPLFNCSFSLAGIITITEVGKGSAAVPNCSDDGSDFIDIYIYRAAL